MNKICAIVVTYNRKILLKQSLQALTPGNTLMTSYKKSELITSTREPTLVGQGALTTV